MVVRLLKGVYLSMHNLQINIHTITHVIGLHWDTKSNTTRFATEKRFEVSI